MKNEFDKTQQLGIDDFVKSIPVICSWCNQIYEIKQWYAEKGVEAGASYGMCPECEKKHNNDSSSTNEEEGDEPRSEDTAFNQTIVLNVDEMLKSIPIVCAWCNKIYHIKAWEVKEGNKTAVSHGICAECEKRQQAELASLKKNN